MTQGVLGAGMPFGAATAKMTRACLAGKDSWASRSMPHGGRGTAPQASWMVFLTSGRRSAAREAKPKGLLRVGWFAGSCGAAGQDVDTEATWWSSCWPRASETLSNTAATAAGNQACGTAT